MASVPSACQSLADLVASLEQQYTDSAAKAAGLSGAQAWSALGQLGSVLAQLTDARDRLDQCVKTNSAALIGNVIVMDASGAGAAAGAQTAILWELADTGPTARDTTQENSTLKLFRRMPSAASLSIRGVSWPRTDPYAPTSPHPRLSGKIRTMFGRAAWAAPWTGIARIAARNANPSRLTRMAGHIIRTWTVSTRSS